MPTYAYKCPNCGHARDVVKRLMELDLPVRCEHEYEHDVYGRVTCIGFMERVPSRANFTIKGFNQQNGYSHK